LIELEDVDLFIREQIIDGPLERRGLLIARHAIEDQLDRPTE
jgi:hypothetical protein